MKRTAKDDIFNGLRFYLQNNAEFCSVSIKGDVSQNIINVTGPPVFDAYRTEVCEKPSKFHDQVEKMMADGTKLDICESK